MRKAILVPPIMGGVADNEDQWALMKINYGIQNTSCQRPIGNKFFLSSRKPVVFSCTLLFYNLETTNHHLKTT